jgi:hypothetical protein
MNFTKWADARVRKMGWVDIALIKMAVVGFVLVVAKLWTPLISFEWYWYALLCVLCAIRPLSKVFKKA